MTLKSIAQLFILGCSWGLGFFMVEEVGKTVGSIIAYTFTIINILQGVLLFVVYCLLNLQVQMEFKKWFHGLWKGIETESTEVSRSTNHTKMEKLETSSEIFCRRDPASSVQPPPGVQLVTVSWVRAESWAAHGRHPLVVTHGSDTCHLLPFPWKMNSVSTERKGNMGGILRSRVQYCMGRAIKFSRILRNDEGNKWIFFFQPLPPCPRRIGGPLDSAYWFSFGLSVAFYTPRHLALLDICIIQ